MAQRMRRTRSLGGTSRITSTGSCPGPTRTCLGDTPSSLAMVLV
eukprot:CAMPEP_0172200852 /NCGR_PEP_ID=MMETSP1050-20130122/29605_1 /TAXON_ID=233186 /ORGANISM="Cryptomonas curvata, Strain CCAP979/52" /LENGTH=43 /DNA_ID= /DNA_START= /DNA_END= /DNA_ORIENTATION=